MGRRDLRSRQTSAPMASQIFVKDGRMRPVLRVLVYLTMVVALGSLVALASTRLWASEALFAIVVVGCAVFLRVVLDRRSVASLGLSFRTRWARLFFLGVALGAGMQLFAFAVELALGASHVTGFGSLKLGGGALASWAALFVVAALAEEYPLRGYILQNLWEEAGFWPAAIATSVFFAFLHFHNPHFGEHPWIAACIIAVDGIWASLGVLWTRSLWLSWGAHFAWNLFEGPVLGTPVSGIDTGFSLVTQRVTGPSVLTGSTFGPEAGLIGLLAELVGLAALYALYRFGAFSSLPDTREEYAVPRR
jgi:membrane protease YdiL (CAAX protease family)